MRVVPVSLGSRSYEILIGSGLLDELGTLLEPRNLPRKLFVVSDSQIFDLFGERLEESLSTAGFEVQAILIPPGEVEKNLKTIELIIGNLIAEGADRASGLLALGGGVVGDVTGFAAACFMRGIPYVQVPTTLLAQVDSSVGGKTGVNHPFGKNMIGAFHQPKLVCVDVGTLQSLPRSEFRSGLYEVVKYGLIRDAEFLKDLQSGLDKMLGLEREFLEGVIERCCRIKADVTAHDERESDLRRILNFGHTVGHGIEAALGYSGITHGEAVGYGMLSAIELSARLGHLSSYQSQMAAQAVRSVGPLTPVPGLSFSRLWQAMQSDKKWQGGKPTFVLLEAIGKTRIEELATPSLLEEIWEEIGNPAK